MRKRILLPLIAVAALATAVGARTLLMPSRQLVVAPVAPAAIDTASAAARLAAAVRFRTIASPGENDVNAGEFQALQAHIKASFPRVHQALKREVIGRHALLYTWAGSDPAAPGIGLMAHQDVVPIAAGTEGDWQQPPFSGELTGGFVWGRGAWDDKGNLLSILEAVEMRLAAGFVPRRTIYLVFGDDEEVGGERGAAQIAQLLKSRNVRLQFVIDEGLLITEGVLKGLDRPAALVGVA